MIVEARPQASEFAPHAARFLGGEAWRAAEPAEPHPVVFNGHFGWLHPAAGPAPSGIGVVLCSPIGRDAQVTHLPWRIFAERLAAAGFATLRFDHLDSGESLDLPPDGDNMPVWVDGVVEAADFLRAHAHVTDVALVGIRLGGSLAALAAERANARALGLLAPVTKGRLWIRELLLASAMEGPQLAPPEDQTWIESNGLTLSAATLKSLNALDLNKLTATTPNVMLAAQTAAVAGLAPRLTALGAEVECHDFPGYADLFQDAHHNEPPLDTFDLVTSWLNRLEPVRPGRPSGVSPAPLDEPVLRLPGAIERPIRMAGGLRGVVCEPDRPSADAQAVLFLNTGAAQRTGVGRFSTIASRALARRGVTSLRFDFAGLGDSPSRDGEVRTHPMTTSREADMDAAFDALKSLGFDEATVVGVCSGAHHAFHSAARDPRITKVFAASLVKYFWREGDSLNLGQGERARSFSFYLSAIRDPRYWVHTLKGKVSIGQIATALAARLVKRFRTRLQRKEIKQLRDSVAEISRQGRSIHLFMGLRDTALDELETYFGRGGRHFTKFPRMTMTVIPEIDHSLGFLHSRECALRDLFKYLELEPGGEL